MMMPYRSAPFASSRRRLFRRPAASPSRLGARVVLALTMALGLLFAPGVTNAAQARPAYCDGKWKATGVWSIGGKTSSWLPTAKGTHAAQYVKFRVLKQEQYRRYRWTGSKCVKSVKWNKSADRYKLKVCDANVGCGQTSWRSWRKPYGVKLRFLGQNYALDPASGYWRWGW